MKLLVVVAHPDDASIFCGGTLCKHARRGDEVHVAYMTRGEYGGTEQDSEAEVAELRSSEAERAMDHLVANYSFLSFKDGRIEYNLENRFKLMDVIREHQPDLIITHSDKDDHPDHRKTGELVSDAYYMASLPMVDSEFEPWDPDNIFYFGKPNSDFAPDLFVDISDVFDLKQRAVKEHESQVKFLREHEGIDRTFDDLAEDVRAEARHYGRQANVKFAEAFSRLHAEAEDYLG
jgi:LmbE family N-acetylglucosaminyl deacetylase